MDTEKKKLALYGVYMALLSPAYLNYAMFYIPDLFWVGIDEGICIQELARRGAMRRYLLASGK